eukprot:scaffold3148_cov275-Pinguiococcus_pyrenoidosus.AAC.4
MWDSRNQSLSPELVVVDGVGLDGTVVGRHQSKKQPDRHPKQDDPDGAAAVRHGQHQQVCRSQARKGPPDHQHAAVGRHQAAHAERGEHTAEDGGCAEESVGHLGVLHLHRILEQVWQKHQRRGTEASQDIQRQRQEELRVVQGGVDGRDERWLCRSLFMSLFQLAEQDRVGHQDQQDDHHRGHHAPFWVIHHVVVIVVGGRRGRGEVQHQAQDGAAHSHQSADDVQQSPLGSTLHQLDAPGQSDDSVRIKHRLPKRCLAEGVDESCDAELYLEHHVKQQVHQPLEIRSQEPRLKQQRPAKRQDGRQEHHERPAAAPHRCGAV